VAYGLQSLVSKNKIDKKNKQCTLLKQELCKIVP